MLSVSLALNLYTGEIYPTRIRAFAGSVGGAWQRVAAAIGPNVVAWLLPDGTGLFALFLYFGGLAIIAGALAVVLLRHRNQGPDARGGIGGQAARLCGGLQAAV